MSDFMRVEDLMVYQKLCDLHIDMCELARTWPADERFELGSQLRRCSNRSPANLAEKHSDRHVPNRIKGVNRARGEALEAVHHLYIALRKRYIEETVFESFRHRYQECVRMLNGLERTLERQLDKNQRRFPTVPEPRSPNPNPEP